MPLEAHHPLPLPGPVPACAARVGGVFVSSHRNPSPDVDARADLDADPRTHLDTRAPCPDGNARAGISPNADGNASHQDP